MDQGAKIIILKDKKKEKQFSEIHVLSKNLRRAILERRLILLEDEYGDLLNQLEEEENDG